MSSPIRSWVLHPWLVGAYPVVFLYAQNLDYVEWAAALRVLPAALIGVTMVFLALRLWLRSALRGGLLTTILAVLFFSFGAVHDSLAEALPAGGTVLLAVWIALAVGATLMVARSRERPALNRVLNVAALVLVAMPLVQIGRAEIADASERAGRAEESSSATATATPTRDIYYVILDEYQRQDRLLEAYGFDNSGFVDALRERGFYVAPGAHSNYTKTILSLASTLNMTYLDEVLARPGRVISRLRRMVESHQVGRQLERYGYTYVHVSSGKHPTATSQIADLVIDFAPAGELRFEADGGGRARVLHDYREFSRLVLGSTLLGQLLRPDDLEVLVRDREVPYLWYAPERTLASFESVAGIAEMPEPTFTFFHVIKPHAPYMFDRQGRVLEKPAGWSWEDGRDDERAMLEQMEFLNRLVLELVDRILARSEITPIIVLQGDHGENLFAELEERVEVLSAFLLPDGGERRLYPTISNVNTFRIIFDHYFDHDLEPLPDRAIVSDGDRLVEVEVNR